MKSIILFVFLSFNICVLGQNLTEEIGTVNLYVGAKTRVTPLYIKRVPDFIHIGLIDVFEQPDMHLSGPGFSITERMVLKNNWYVNLNQTIRYDYIYQRLPLVATFPTDFKYTIGKKIIIDLYADLAKRIPSRKSSFFSLLFGFGICGLNTEFNQTIRFYSTQNNYLDYTIRKNFIFPTISSGLGWQWKNLYSELKFGYCWNNPTLYDTPFIFPEVCFQYNFSSLFKRKIDSQ